MDFRNLTIVQILKRSHVDRGRKGRPGSVRFWVIPRTSAHCKHIFFDHTKYWNMAGWMWDSKGYAIEAHNSQPLYTPKCGVKKTVRFDTATYPPVALVSITVFDKGNPVDMLKQLLGIFESTCTIRVYISVLGTTKSFPKLLTNFLKKVRDTDRDLFRDRFVLYRNVNTYKNLVRRLSVTHVVDTRSGYLGKVCIADDHVRQSILFNKTPVSDRGVRVTCLKEAFTSCDTWEEVVNSISVVEPETQRRRPTLVEPLTRLGPGTLDLRTNLEEFNIVAWNMNSFRSVYHSGHLIPFLKTTRADVICITECRGTPQDILRLPGVLDTLRQQRFYYTYWNSASPNPGLYGTAMISKLGSTLGSVVQYRLLGRGRTCYHRNL